LKILNYLTTKYDASLRIETTDFFGRLNYVEYQNVTNGAGINYVLQGKVVIYLKFVDFFKNIKNWPYAFLFY